MFTLAGEQTADGVVDDHYTDFLRTVAFLSGPGNPAVEELRTELEIFGRIFL